MPRPFLSIRPRIVYLIWTNNPVEIRLLLLFLRKKKPTLFVHFFLPLFSIIVYLYLETSSRLVSSRVTEASEQSKSAMEGEKEEEGNRRGSHASSLPLFSVGFSSLEIPSNAHASAKKRGRGRKKREKRGGAKRNRQAGKKGNICRSVGVEKRVEKVCSKPSV